MVGGGPSLGTSRLGPKGKLWLQPRESPEERVAVAASVRRELGIRSQGSSLEAPYRFHVVTAQAVALAGPAVMGRSSLGDRATWVG